MVSSKALQLRPEKRALYRELDALISRQGPIKDAKTLEAKAKRKAKIQEATQATMRKWKAQASRDLKGMSRRELLERIVKKAGAAKARTGVKEKRVLKAMVDVDASLIFLPAAYRFFRPSKTLSIISRPPWYSPSPPSWATP